jgi:Flp pilus assembly protein protease CpaA
MAVFIIFMVVLAGQPLAVIVFLLRRNWIQFWTALIVALCVLATIPFFWLAHSVATGNLSRIQLGMSREEAIRLLGQPISTKRFSDGRSEISYKKAFRIL